MNQFTMVGKVSVAKDTDKRKAFDTMTFASGWKKKELRLVMKCGEDTFYPIVTGMRSPKNEVGTLIQEGDNYKYVTFNYRDVDKYLPLVPEFKKYKFVDGADRKEVIDTYDLAELVFNRLIEGAYKDKFVKLTGEIVYNAYEDKFSHEMRQIKKYEVHAIHVLEGEVEPKAMGNVDIFFDEDALDETNLDKGVFKVTGYVGQYDGKKKKAGLTDNMGFVEQFEYILTEKQLETEARKQRVIDTIRKCLTPVGTDTLSKTGFNFKLINRTESVELTEDMLSEDDKFDLECGLTTMYELREKYGAGNGDRVEKLVIGTFKNKYKQGAEKTVITLSELLMTAEEYEKQQQNNSFEIVDDSDMFVDDLFGDSDPF